MTTERKRWWKMAALAVVGGGVITGGWYRFVRATPHNAGDAEQSWKAAATTVPAAPPAVAEVERLPEPAQPTGPVTPAGGAVPTPEVGGAVTPGIPIVPVSGPPVPAPALPSLPVPAIPPIEPAGGPRQPDTGLAPAGKGTLPAAPAIPPLGLPGVPTPPKPLDIKPPVPAVDAPNVPAASTNFPTASPAAPPAIPGLPPLPGATAEPPKASPVVPPMPAIPAPPAAPVIPQPPELAPSVPPVKPASPVQPMPPAKPDSGLNVPKPGNTLNPTVSPLPPITLPGATGGETPGTPVDRTKPPESKPGPSDRFVFPVPAVPNPIDSHPRDDAMHKLTATAAFAVLSGALLGAEKASAAFPAIPAPSGIPTPGALVKADDKADAAQLKKDLEEANKKITEANKKIDELQKQVATLTDLLRGKKDDKGITLPSDPGAVAEIKELKNKIAGLEKELGSLKTQTSLKPSVGTPEAKPTGTVKIINDYPVEVRIVVNDRSYHVAPNKVLDVEVPAGEFTYQLLTAGAPATKSAIHKGETVRLRIK
jgi:hypothetical protein